MSSAFFPWIAAEAKSSNDNKVTNRENPNVIIILADDLGYGAKNVSTLNIDRLAAQGVRFTNAHAVASTSTPSRYSLLTGEYALCLRSKCRDRTQTYFATYS